jgi:hypothetical protein
MPIPSEDQDPKICFVATMAIMVIVLVAIMKPWTIDNRDAALDFVAPVGVLVFMGLVGCLLPDLEWCECCVSNLMVNSFGSR